MWRKLILLISATTSPVWAAVVGTGTAASCTQESLETALAMGETVTFNCGGVATILLNRDLAQIKLNTVINGGNVITIDGQGKYRIFHTAAGRSSTTGEKDIVLEVRNITLQNGYTSERGGAISMNYYSKLRVSNVNFFNNVASRETNACDGGGAIWLDAENTTLIENSVFIGNKANNGGGVNTVFSDVSIQDSYFEGNQALHTAHMDTLNNCGGGGAVRFEGTRKAQYAGTGKLLIERSLFIENSTNHAGGALETYLYDNGESLDIRDSYFLRNKSLQYGQGGAIAYMNAHPATGLFTLRDSTVAYNHSDLQGGGVYTLTNTRIINSSIVGNIVKSPDSANISDKEQWKRGFGAGLRFADQSNASTYEILNSTIAYNQAEALGGGVKGGGSQASFKNSIIANNEAKNTYLIQINCIDPLKNAGNNLQRNSGLKTDKPCFTDLPSTDPLLESQLRYLGGLVPVLPLKAGSPAINAGANCEAYDGRGLAREGVCDIGAVEFVNEPATALKSQIQATEISLTLQPAASNRGKTGYLYAAFMKNGVLYFLDEFTQVLGWSNKPALSQATQGIAALHPLTAMYGVMPYVFSTPNAQDLNLSLSHADALRLFAGASEVFVGYARNQADLLNNTRFGCAFKLMNNKVVSCN
ncbi:MAG: choice-of-anchor Q domain-containing protein [Thiotrichaceae bacterium]|nr:choice-of-anchor Q domain-containing protein [Thiotrichaceae bacterium]